MVRWLGILRLQRCKRGSASAQDDTSKVLRGYAFTLRCGLGWGGGLLGLESVDFDGVDTEAVHADDGVAVAIEFEAITGFGNALEFRKNKSAKGFEAFIARQMDLMFRFQIADVH